MPKTKKQQSAETRHKRAVNRVKEHHISNEDLFILRNNGIAVVVVRTYSNDQQEHVNVIKTDLHDVEGYVTPRRARAKVAL